MKILLPLIFTATLSIATEPKKFGPRDPLRTAVEISIQPTRERGEAAFPAGSPVRVLLDGGKDEVLILIGETKEQAIVPRTAIAGSGESDGRPIKVRSIQPPEELSYVRKDGPVGIWTGVATGDENVPSSSEAMEMEILRLTNIERAKRGLAPLAWDEDLARAARYQAADSYVQDYSTKGHVTQDAIVREGKPPGYFTQDFMENRVRRFLPDRRNGIGENAQARRNDASAAKIIEEWMNSPGHRANILEPRYRRLGVGYITSTTGAFTWAYSVQNFSGEP